MVNSTRSNRRRGLSRSVRRKTVIKLGRADSIATAKAVKTARADNRQASPD